MDVEGMVKWFGGGAFGLAFVFLLTKLFNSPPFKKNGNGHSMMDEMLMIGKTLADNNTKLTVLVDEIHRTTQRNSEKLDALVSKAEIAMERQSVAYKKIDDMRT